MAADITPQYTAEVTTTGGRVGHAVSSDGVLDVELRRPKVQGVNDGTNPEQLFAAAWGACFLGALGGAGKEAGVDVSEARATVSVSIGEDATNGGKGLSAAIAIAIPGVDLAEAQQLVDRAHELCPYSKATRGNVAVDVTAVEA